MSYFVREIVVIFLKKIELLTKYNDDVPKVILQNASYNSRYISTQIHKEILHIIANKVQKYICEEIG